MKLRRIGEASKIILWFIAAATLVGSPHAAKASDTNYTVVDTAQTMCYDNSSGITCPQLGEAFYGQDAQHQGNQPGYVDNGNGTVTDNITGLMWQKSPDTNSDGVINSSDKFARAEVQTYLALLNAQNFGGYSDWRVPSIKELYSLIDFRGTDPDPMSDNTAALTPFINPDYFAFAYGDTSAGERIIDVQFLSSTQYMGTVFNGRTAVFGVNFADGRIKGYPSDKTFYVLCVRGNTNYGQNDLADNGDGTITDHATGLMWEQTDSGVGLNWLEALAWVQTQNATNYLGYSDWRLPNAKELQSIVDYTRSPDATSSAAIDRLFYATSITNEAGQSDYPCYWSSTTHANPGITPGVAGAYVAFGRAMGYMNGLWMDVHGAGAQRSDPKSGNPADYPFGRGPQGDAIRIYNYVRLVRDASGGSLESSSLMVTITPQAAVTAGAQWRVDGGDWHGSSETVSGLSVGQHIVEFKQIPRWRKPQLQVIEIGASGAFTASGSYVRAKPLPWLTLLFNG